MTSSVYAQELSTLREWAEALTETYSARVDLFLAEVNLLHLSVLRPSFSEEHVTLFSHLGHITKQGAIDFVAWLANRLPVLRGGDWYQQTTAFSRACSWVFVQINGWFIPMRESQHWSALVLHSSNDTCIRVLPWYELGHVFVTEQQQNDPDLLKLVREKPKPFRAAVWHSSNDPEEPNGPRAVSCFQSSVEAVAFALLVEESFFNAGFQGRPYSQLTTNHVCLTWKPSDIRKALNSMLMVIDEETLAEALRQERYGLVYQPMCL